MLYLKILIAFIRFQTRFNLVHQSWHSPVQVSQATLPIKFDELIHSLLFAEGVQAGQDLGIVIMVQTNAADQELLVYLPDHRTCAAGLSLSHGDRHSHGAQGPINLRAHTQTYRTRHEKASESHEGTVKQGEEGVFPLA